MSRSTVTAADGYVIAMATHEPEEAPRAVVQINSATGVPQRYYASFSRWLNERGYAVVTFDYRGMGESLHGPVAKVEGTIDSWGRLDAAAITHHCAARWPDLPLIGLGHSMGGQQFGLQPNVDRFERLVGVCAQSGYTGDFPEEAAPAMRAMWTSIPPLVEKHGYFPGNEVLPFKGPPGIMLSWLRWINDPNYFVEEDGSSMQPLFDRVACPFRFIAVTDDPIAPPSAVRALQRVYRKAATEYVEIDPSLLGRSVGHFSFFRAENAELWQQTTLRDLRNGDA